MPGRVPENPRTRTLKVKPDKLEPELCKEMKTRSNPNPNFKPAGTRTPLKIGRKHQKFRILQKFAMETCTFTQIRVFLSLITLKLLSIMCNFGYSKFTQFHNSNPNPINPRTRTSKVKPDEPEPELC